MHYQRDAGNETFGPIMVGSFRLNGQRERCEPLPDFVWSRDKKRLYDYNENSNK